jgi:YbbR domain-containing protein
VLVDYKKIMTGISKNWPAKVLSVAVAIFLFAFHRMGDLQERFFSVPLRLDINSNLVPGSSYQRNIRVTLRGDANSIYAIEEDDIELYADLTMFSEPGTYKVLVQIQKKGTVAENETLEINLDPIEISLELDTKMSKYVPLSPSFQGYLESGYEMVSYTLEPNQVVIDGPLKLLTGISELSTESIDLRSRNTDFSSRVRIMNPNPLLVLRGDGMTEFRGFIRELIEIRNFDNLSITVNGLDDAFEAVLEPPAASVRIQGVQKYLDAFIAQNILTVDCSAVNEEGSYDLPLVVTVGSELTVDRREPETVRVIITRREGEREEE